MRRKMIKCSCGKSFPFNPEKHEYDDYIYCPFCRKPHRNMDKKRLMPVFRSVVDRIRDWQYYREVGKFLSDYGFRITTVDPKTGKTVTVGFSISSWKKGRRPNVTVENVKNYLANKMGRQPTREEIDREIARIMKLFEGEIETTR